MKIQKLDSKFVSSSIIVLFKAVVLVLLVFIQYVWSLIYKLYVVGLTVTVSVQVEM